MSSSVVLVWSVDELQASEEQTRMSCDPDGCVALCFSSSREFRGCSGLVRLKGTPARRRFNNVWSRVHEFVE